MGLLDSFSALSGSNSNLADAVSNSKGEGNKKALQQFEPCKIKGCKWLNEEGFCAKETCVVLNEHPQTTMLATKLCMFCGSKFTTNLDSMQIQICPECLGEALLATRRGGEEDSNAISGTVNVGDEKLQAKVGKTKGLDLASSFADLFGSDVLSNLIGQGQGIELSNIVGDLETLSDSDNLSMDLGEGISEEVAKSILGDSGGHPCMFCGTAINKNPSLFFPCCPACFENLTTTASVIPLENLAALAECDPHHLKLAGTESHCYKCDD